MTHWEGVGKTVGEEESVMLVTYTAIVGLGVPGYRGGGRDNSSIHISVLLPKTT